MNLILTVATTLITTLSSDEPPSTHLDFEFYLEELISHELPESDPMITLIEDGLVDAVFDTTSDSEFKARISRLHQALRAAPDKAERFDPLNQKLSRVFELKLAKAKRQRTLYAIGGAVTGAVVAIPISRLISKTATSLVIAIPVGALVGAGAGFLLGDVIAMPDYTFEPGTFNSDLEDINDFLGREPL